MTPPAVRPSGDAILNFIETHYRTLLIALILASTAAKLALIPFVTNLDPATAETQEYGSMALELLKHGEMVRERIFADGTSLVYPSAYMPPFHIFVWAALFGIFGNTPAALLAMVLLNIASSAAVIWLTARIGLVLLPAMRAASLAAAAIIAFYPTFVYAAVTYQTVNFYLALLLAAFLLANALADRPGWRMAAILGAVGGITALYRTEYVLFMAVFYVGAWLAHRDWRVFAVSVLASFLVVAPWTLRNYIVFDRLIPVAQSTGYNLWKGFNPEANGSGHHSETSGASEIYLRDRLDALPRTDMFERDRDDVFKEGALAFIADNPVKAFIELPPKKVLLFWTLEYHDPDVTLRPAYLAAFIPTFLLTLWGMWTAWHDRRPNRAERLMLALFAAQTVVMVGYAVHARYRMNVEPFLFVYAGLAVMDLWNRLGLHDALSRGRAAGGRTDPGSA